MNDITHHFGTLYHPVSALVIYQADDDDNWDTYVEHFDMDKDGNPINAHPLSEREAKILAKSLNTKKEKNKAFLKPESILPTNILYINPTEKGSVIWYTKARKTKLFFTESLEIPNGTASIPAMLWVASKQHLTVFTLISDKRPTEKTALYHAPFFNVYENGNVCMGTVNVDIKKSASVEEFIRAWEHYFFNSKFSHLNNHNPTNGNCVNMWKELMDTEKPFPKEILKKTNKILKNILP
ncbi:MULTISPECIES: PRTRC system protein B [unclassified Chryseobacterium]|uniref:PRTRC system protein B n=1 Tax=unclassified Chryseobacterium TaxID=2593645 RepID=UPI000D3A8FBD|nr:MULTISPECIES: PRTRC system protein B [unclassified Chryseobacterium]PTT38489.1 PRTRC system protein B [Chryseobacterium sp. HMWF028]PTT73716.1 PRTRC system protein B [Chryseobacterium sp. HMWF001]PVV61603.1 PRTRC system protein B [Chryseobacterium sp. HMWF035]